MLIFDRTQFTLLFFIIEGKKLALLLSQKNKKFYVLKKFRVSITKLILPIIYAIFKPLKLIQEL